MLIGNARVVSFCVVLRDAIDRAGEEFERQ